MPLLLLLLSWKVEMLDAATIVAAAAVAAFVVLGLVDVAAAVAVK